MQNKFSDEDTLIKLHNVELEILDKFVKICEDNNLNYFLTGGTMIGAVRHSGFIPWDDDIDVGMLRDDYEKFIKIAQKELGDKYYLDCFEKNTEYYLQFAKIKKNNTIFDEKASHFLKNHKGIFIDIFPFDNVYDNLKRSHFNAVLIKAMGSAMNVKMKVKRLKDVRNKFLVIAFYLIPRKMLMKIEKWLCTKNKNNNSKYVVCYVGSYPFYNELLERCDILPTKKLVFEKRKYQVMNNYGKYLRGLYGEYMALPPKEKRVTHLPLRIEFDNKGSDENG